MNPHINPPLYDTIKTYGDREIVMVAPIREIPFFVTPIGSVSLFNDEIKTSLHTNLTQAGSLGNPLLLIPYGAFVEMIGIEENKGDNPWLIIKKICAYGMFHFFVNNVQICQIPVPMIARVSAGKLPMPDESKELLVSFNQEKENKPLPYHPLNSDGNMIIRSGDLFGAAIRFPNEPLYIEQGKKVLIRVYITGKMLVPAGF